MSIDVECRTLTVRERIRVTAICDSVGLPARPAATLAELPLDGWECWTVARRDEEGAPVPVLVTQVELPDGRLYGRTFVYDGVSVSGEADLARMVWMLMMVTVRSAVKSRMW